MVNKADARKLKPGSIIYVDGFPEKIRKVGKDSSGNWIIFVNGEVFLEDDPRISISGKSIMLGE